MQTPKGGIPHTFGYKAVIDGKLVKILAIFWDSQQKINEIRYLDKNNELVAVKGAGIETILILPSTGTRETSTGTFSLVYQGDVVEIEYQKKNSICCVDWCKRKSSFVLRPLKGNSPVNSLHFRLSGKKMKIIGNMYDGSYKDF